jgi:hypothetical protein
MTFAIHTEAAKRAQELAVHALDGLSSEPSTAMPPRSSYSPETHIEASLGPDDIASPIVGARTDRFGREVEKWYGDKTRYLVLRGAAFSEFEKAVSIIHQQRTVRESVSRTTLGKLVFEWMCNIRIHGPASPLIETIVARLQELVREHDILIPVYGLHVEMPLSVGRVAFADMTAMELDAWHSSALREGPDRSESINTHYKKLRKQLQGRAAARFQILAEEEYAVQRAREEAELSIAILRLGTPSVFTPESPSTLALSGREVVARGVHFLLNGDAEPLSGEYILHPQDLRPFMLDREILPGTIATIQHWSELLRREQRSELEKTALASALLYSRSSQYRNISERLIHIFAAIESLLLRNETEPISATLADRLAFCVGRNPLERQRIARNLREIYPMRSRYVHHALETAPDGEQLEKLEAFLVTIAQFFINLRTVMARVATKDAFLDALDRRKYA